MYIIRKKNVVIIIVHNYRLRTAQERHKEKAYKNYTKKYVFYDSRLIIHNAIMHNEDSQSKIKKIKTVLIH